MDVFTIILWVGTVAFLVFSIIKDKKKTKRSLKMALGMGKNLVFSILSIVFAIGLLLAIFPPEIIAEFVGKQSLFVAGVLAAVVGTITLVPAIIAFPLVGTLVSSGVGVVPAVAFLTTLTMVGVVTFPMERKEFGTKFTVVRNGFSFIFAILIALVMGVFI